MTIPDGFIEVRFTQIASLSSGVEPVFSQYGYPVYGANGIIGYCETYSHNDVIVIGRVGSAGEITMVRERCHVSDNALIAEEIPQVISKDYLLNLLIHMDLKTEIIQSNQPLLTQGRLNRKLLIIPHDITEQESINEVIRSANQVLNLQRQLIMKLEMMRKGMLNDFLTYGIDEDGALRSPETHDFELFGLNQIPSSWEMRTLESLGIDVIDGDRGKNYPKKSEMEPNGYCLFLSAKNVTKTGFKFDEKMFITQTKHETLRNGALTRGDIVITTRGTVGQFSLFSDDIHFEYIRINSGMAIIRNNSAEISNEYLFMALNSDLIKKQISLVSYGTAQQQLNIPQISNLMIPFCSSEEQTRLLHSYNSLQNRLDVENRILDKYRKIKLGLVNDLLTGRVRVPTPAPDEVEVAA